MAKKKDEALDVSQETVVIGGPEAVMASLGETVEPAKKEPKTEVWPNGITVIHW